jgi:hypothetical protein
VTCLRLHPGSQWIEVDLSAPLQAWVVQTVNDRWAAQHLDPNPERAEVIAGSIARIVGTLDTAAVEGVLLLYPAANKPVVTVVGLRVFPAPSGLRLDGLEEELCVPDEMLERPRHRSIVETPAGKAVRLVQRYREPLSPGVEEIRDHVAYGWLVADRAVFVSTTFIDLVDAGIWINAVDELARSATR